MKIIVHIAWSIEKKVKGKTNSKVTKTYKGRKVVHPNVHYVIIKNPDLSKSKKQAGYYIF